MVRRKKKRCHNHPYRPARWVGVEQGSDFYLCGRCKWGQDHQMKGSLKEYRLEMKPIKQGSRRFMRVGMDEWLYDSIRDYAKTHHRATAALIREQMEKLIEQEAG